MADTKKKDYTVGLTQSTGGQLAPTMNGLPVNVNVQSAGKGTSSKKTTATGTGSTYLHTTNSSTPLSGQKSVNGLPLPTYSPVQQYATLPDGTATGLMGRQINLSDPLATPMPEPNNQKKSTAAATEETKSSGGGRGGTVLPSVPAQLANQIADAYARTQGAGPDPYDNRYQAEIEAMRGQRYGDYESQYLPKIDNLVDRLLNRDSFSYNWSDDPLYRQYAARYQQQARQGMQDTMGQAAALTGGYGNSYATAAANQAYANTMAGLNDRAMDLYQLAAENYDRDTNNLRSNLQQLEQREAANRGYYDTDRATFYDRQDADLNNLYNQQAMDYQMWQDALARDQYEKDMAWQQYQYWNNLAHNKYKYY